MSSKRNFVKKTSPNKKIILYIGRRDYVDHYKLIDAIDGIIIVPPPQKIPAESSGTRLLLEIQLRISYESDQLRADQTKSDKVIVVASCQLFPNDLKHKDQAKLNCWQNGLFRKFVNMDGVCPFTLNFPLGSTPTSLDHVMDGETCRINYQLVAFWCTDPSQPVINRDPIEEANVLNLPLMPLGRPSGHASHRLALSAGHIDMELSLDKGAFFFGEEVHINAVINNSTNRTIRKIKCKMFQVVQFSSSPGVRHIVMNSLETTDGCPLTPGSSLQRTFTLTANRQPHRSRRNFVFEDPLKGQLRRMLGTTVFPNTDPAEGYTVLVSYEIKMKAYLSSVIEGDVSVSVPFLMLHAPPHGRVQMRPPVTKLSRKKRFTRLISWDDITGKQEEPLIPV